MNKIEQEKGTDDRSAFLERVVRKWGDVIWKESRNEEGDVTHENFWGKNIPDKCKGPQTA